MSNTVAWKEEFAIRFAQRFDELKWLYCEVYNNDMQAFHWLADAMYQFYEERNAPLKALDRKREQSPFWYSTNDLIGMMLYVDNFADNLKGVRKKIDYINLFFIIYNID